MFIQLNSHFSVPQLYNFSILYSINPVWPFVLVLFTISHANSWPFTYVISPGLQPHHSLPSAIAPDVVFVLFLSLFHFSNLEVLDNYAARYFDFDWQNIAQVGYLFLLLMPLFQLSLLVFVFVILQPGLGRLRFRPVAGDLDRFTISLPICAFQRAAWCLTPVLPPAWARGQLSSLLSVLVALVILGFSNNGFCFHRFWIEALGWYGQGFSFIYHNLVEASSISKP